MNGEIAAAERAKESRDAARAWRRAGFIGEEALSRILALYPDDRRRFGPGLRALAFIFTGIAAQALIGLWFFFLDQNAESAGSYVIWALALAALTEFQRGPLKRVDAGAESATALLAAVFAVIALVIGFGGTKLDDMALRFLVAALFVCSLAAWRWGESLFFLGAGLSGFGLLAQTDRARLVWIAASVVLIPACIRAAREPRLAPSHRRGAVILGGVAILALYGAIHIWSLDRRLIESMRIAQGRPWDGYPSVHRPLSMVATALLPITLLLIGWRRREPLLLHSGLLLIGASIATIRLYRTVMPLSFALILLGAVCMGLALGVRRWLRSGERGERDGFTADPLLDNTNRTEVIRSVVAVASFTPAAQPAPAARPSGFEGGGGSFGGGGATGSYQ